VRHRRCPHEVQFHAYRPQGPPRRSHSLAASATAACTDGYGRTDWGSTLALGAGVGSGGRRLSRALAATDATVRGNRAGATRGYYGKQRLPRAARLRRVMEVGDEDSSGGPRRGRLALGGCYTPYGDAGPGRVRAARRGVGAVAGAAIAGSARRPTTTRRRRPVYYAPPPPYLRRALRVRGYGRGYRRW
jgi:hypothetical protein